MIDWLKNISKKFPEFYKEYLNKFEFKSKRYVVISSETTGLNPKLDVMLSFAAIAIENNNIVIKDSIELGISQYKFLHDNNLTNEFFIDNKLPKLTENEAIEIILKFISNAKLVGHRVHFDIEMLNQILEKYECGTIKNESFDIEVMYKKLHDINDKDFSINELAKHLNTPISDRNSVSDDCYTIALLFLKLKSKLGIEDVLK